jgi:hypothetical protein
MVGKPRRYRDTLLPLPEKTQSGIQVIAVDKRWRKLYLVYTISAAQPTGEARVLSVYDLHANGEPGGPPRTVEARNPNKSIVDMTLHPRLPLLYTVGQGGSAVCVYAGCHRRANRQANGIPGR